VQTLIYQFVVLTKINRLTLKRFEQKYLLLSWFTFEVVEISPANILYSIQCMNETLYRWTFNFHKVMRQQNSSAVEDFILPYSTVYLRIQKWKKYWNRSTFAKVIVKIKVARFFVAHGVYLISIRYSGTVIRRCCHVCFFSFIFQEQVTALSTQNPRSKWVQLFVVCPTQSYGGVTCHMIPHAVLPATQHSTSEYNTSLLNSSQTGRYSIYLPRRYGRLSWPSWLGT